ncbi:SpoIIE family protein phosphatase [Kitasatospora cinereorecta]|uniref:SpoIIE family protein phosphatase n=1 Tax=Kitasatospora cinereorecta TaxID=285560 RepID=UPI0031FA3E47
MCGTGPAEEDDSVVLPEPPSHRPPTPPQHAAPSPAAPAPAAEPSPAVTSASTADDLADVLATTPDAVLAHLVAATPAGLALLDRELRWRFLNPAFADLTGAAPERLLGTAATDPDVPARVLADGRPRTGTLAGHPAHYRRLDQPGLPPAVLVTLTEPPVDAAERRELAQARIRLALLEAVATEVGTTLEPDTTCAELAAFAVRDLADLATVDVLPDAPEPGKAARSRPRLRRAAFAGRPDLRGDVAAAAPPGAPVRYRTGSAVALSLEHGRPVAANLLDPADLDDWAADPPTLAAYRAAGVDSVLAAPLQARGHLIGVLTLARARDTTRDTTLGTTPGFTPDEVALVGELAARAALSLDNARRYARSQGIALELQRALLAEPGSPHPNLELASRYLPSGTSSVVGGDWYETVRLPFGRTLLVMGDVMGHGVEAAVDMSNYRSMLRYVAAMDLPPHRILRQLDALISEEPDARPATCLLALADPARSRWTFASAGHLPPALLAADRATELVEVPTGPPLGTGLGGYEPTSAELRADQVLLLYTDGLVERRGEDIDHSLARLAGLRLPIAGPLDTLLDAVLTALTPHAAEDDIALLAARVRAR